MPTTLAAYTNRPGALGGPLSLRRSGQSRFVLPDMQGHARQLTDSAGNVTDTFTPDAWGVQKAATGTTVNPYKAWGQYGYFTDTPLRLYVRARHLRVDVGRWVSRDPLVCTGGGYETLYQYVRNSPSNLIDASGEFGMKPSSLTCDSICGAARFRIEWIGLGNKTGWIIQHVFIEPAPQYCDGTSKKPAKGNEPGEWWEAWKVVKGKITTGCKPDKGAGWDVFGIEDEGVGSKNKITKTGYVRFVENYPLDLRKWQCPGDPNYEARAQTIPTTHVRPVINGKLWSDTDNGTLLHKLKAEWCCCPFGDKTKFHVSIVPELVPRDEAECPR